MRSRTIRKEALLVILTLFFCWFFVGRFGIFGSSVDWNSQHSVIPDYFRRQFYETGELFPEFALSLGGGQNIYRYAYYGLYSPVILLSYLFPFVKMGDYLMAASIAGLAASALIFYWWLMRRGFGAFFSFGGALMLVLAGPMIYHASKQVMFVNYMPFLCLAFTGVDQYFESHKTGLYTVAVFLMILTSFYYSIGGMLALVIYGLHRWAQMKELTGTAAKKEVAGTAAKKEAAGVAAKNEIAGAAVKKEAAGTAAKNETAGTAQKKAGRSAYSTLLHGGGNCLSRYLLHGLQSVFTFLRDGICFLVPMGTAVLMSAVLLLPTAKALAGREAVGGAGGFSVSELLTPEISVFRVLYSSYGVGLTTLLITALTAGIFWRKWSERLLAWCSIAMLTIPAVLWLLNGGLYTREKVLIPFLPLLVYVILYYLRRLEEHARLDNAAVLSAGADCEFCQNRLLIRKKGCLRYRSEKSLNGTVFEDDRSRRYSARRYLWYMVSGLPYLVTIFLLLRESGFDPTAERYNLLLIDAGIMLLCYFVFCWRKRAAALLAAPVFFLIIFGSSMHGVQNIESRETYERETDPAIGAAVREVLAQEDGFYRIEQYGTSAENGANVNRIWDTGQYITSIYSSAYNSAYHKFRMDTFDVEEPSRNYLVQQSSANPVFRALMGVKYIVTTEDAPQSVTTALEKAGYELELYQEHVKIYKNDKTAPIGYVTNRLISEEQYNALAFPFSQAVFGTYAVAERSAGLARLSKPDENAERTVISGQERTEQRAAVRNLAGWNETDQRRSESVMAEQDDTIGYEDTEIAKCDFSFPLDGTEALTISQTDDGYHIKADRTQTVTAQIEERDESGILYLQFNVKNLQRSRDFSIWLSGVQNKLTSAYHIYKNENTVFTYAVPLEAGQTQVELTFGKGEYELTGIRCYTGPAVDMGELCQSEFIVDKARTKGSRICGRVDTETAGCFISSIPYDEHFTVKVDDHYVITEKVNTAFLGFALQAGSHEIEIVYHAPGLAAGKLLSALGIFLFVLQLFRQSQLLSVLRDRQPATAA